MSDESPRAAWLFSCVTTLLAAAILAVGLGLAAPAAALVGRGGGVVAMVIGVIGITLGGLALTRSRRTV